MSTCCETSDTHATLKSELTVALAGNPNSGKTTIFNAMTGLRQKVANYPGVTVEKKTGRCKLPDGRKANVIDLPGTYSLISRSPDEHVAMEVLRGLRPDTPAPDVVIVVVDASNLQRNLYLVSQLVELGRPLVVALNMMDIAQRRGVRISAEALAKELGIPVIPVVGHRKQGIQELIEAIAQARVAPLPDWPLPEPMKEELLVVGGGLAILDSSPSPEIPGEGGGEGSLSAVPSRAWICREDGARRIDRYQALAERLLIGDRAGDIHHVASQEPVTSLLSSATSRMQQLGIDPMQADIEAHYKWIDGVTRRAAASIEELEELAAMGTPAPAAPDGALQRGVIPLNALDYAPAHTLTQKIDSILIHKIWGLLIFALIMGTLFVSIFWLAAPVMDAFSDSIAWLGGVVTERMGDGPVKDLINDGIFAGVGAVVVFVPQIALLFFFLAILEDSGYLARAAFLMDRLLAKVGLHGKSFIPLLSSFACAIPGIMATRTIESRKDRMATIFVAPFMSCSARLPVYTLLIGTFFAAQGALVQSGIMLSLYALGIVAAAGTAWIFKRSLLKGPATSFILELPTYKVPQWSQVARQVWTNSKEFLTKAGTTIFCLSIILWALMYYPRLPADKAATIDAGIPLRSMFDSPRARTSVDDDIVLLFVPSDGYQQSHLFTPEGYQPPKADWGLHGNLLTYIPSRDFSTATADERKEWAQEQRKTEADKAVAGEQLRHSFAGRFGHVIEPAIKPLGYDWKMGIGLVGAFAAREMFVGTMGIVYSVGDPGDETADLSRQMQADTYGSNRPVWTPLVAISLLVWFVLAMQCMSTLAIVRRETGGWRWPIFMLLYMNGLAYVVSLAVFQIGLAMGYS